jgi:deoxyribonuclease-1
MLDKYQFDLDIEQQEMFRKWNGLYPVSDWECERDRRIADEQGEYNKYVREKCPN